MTKMELNMRQRIGLIVLLSQQTGTLRQVLLLSRILERVDFDTEERTAINWHTEIREDGAFANWNPAAELPAKQVEFDDEEAAQIVVLLKTWKHFTAKDCDWVSPLLEQLPNAVAAPHFH